MDDGILEPLPIRPEPPRPSHPPGRGTGLWIAFLLLTFGVLVILLLREMSGHALPVTPTPTPPPTPTATPDPSLRAAAEAALGDLVAALAPLRPERPELWAPDEWRRVVEVQKNGDAAMAAGNYPIATASYREALEQLAVVRLARAGATARLWSEALRHYAEGSATSAVERIEALLVLDPAHPEAAALLPRARVADRTFALLGSARERFARDESAPAWVDLEQAQSLDPQFPGLAALRAEVAERIATEEFEEWISAALQMVSSGDIDRAAEFLNRAAAFRPQHPAVIDLRTRIEAVRVQREVLALRDRALELEGAERWRDAHEVWVRMLSLDPHAPWIAEGRNRTLKWRTLQERIRQASGALASPQAAELRRELDAMADLPPGLAREAKDFVDRWTLQHTPVTVRITSDGQTQIVLQRVRRWASPFQEAAVDLLPGRYVAVGARPGFRDVRVEFEVRPGAAPFAIDVRCTEAIR